MLAAWTAFLAMIVALLALDLGLFHRRAHRVGVKEALWWSALWISLGVSFTAAIYAGYEHNHFRLGLSPDPIDGQHNDGRSAAVKYLTGYVIEKSLSVDNIFVIATLFGFFAIPAVYQHRVLFWGIFGALVMRGAMIGLGCSLIARYHWIVYLLGAFLLLTAWKMLASSDPTGGVDPTRSGIANLLRRCLPVTQRVEGTKFIIREPRRGGRSGWVLTPLATALCVIETSDVAFAVDSIPAIFAVTADPFLVFTSNVFAILGMRSLYFVVARLLEKLRYLRVTLAAILAVIGLKMLLAPYLKLMLGERFSLYLLALVLLLLVAGVVASLLAKPLPAPAESSDRTSPPGESEDDHEEVITHADSYRI